MTNPTPPGQVPEALRLADECGYELAPGTRAEIAAELLRLHAENERFAALVEAQQPATHVQNPAEIAHVAGDVSKNGAESNMAQRPAPSAAAALPEGWVPLVITHEGQYPEEVAYGPQILMDRLGKWLRKYFDHVVASKAQPSPTPQADSTPVAICNACGAELLEVKQSPNSYLSAEQFDADKLGDWYCKCCPKGPSEGSSTHRYFWNRDLGASAPQADSQPATLAAVASKAVLAAIRAANMQLVQTGDDEFMLVKYKNAEAQCDGGKCGIGGYCEQCPAARAPADSVTAPAGPTDAQIDACARSMLYQPWGIGSRIEDARAFAKRILSNFAHTQPAKAADSALKDHQIAALVNELRDIAIQYHSTQQLRERIARTVVPALKAQAADSVLEDAARLERERICAAIKAEDDYCVDQGDYMLDSDDCIKIVRGEWVRPDFAIDAARKQGANHD